MLEMPMAGHIRSVLALAFHLSGSYAWSESHFQMWARGAFAFEVDLLSH